MHLPSANINICFICDENYIIPTVVAIHSIKKCQAENTNLTIYILTDAISSHGKALLTSLSSEKCSIEVVTVDNSEFRYLHRGDDFYVSTSALIKFRISNILNHLDKILYLDSDIIVQEDLTELWNYNLSDVYAGVVKNIRPYGDANYQTNILKTNHKAYFNSGVLLLNLTRFREYSLESKLLDYRKDGINNNMDQDALNVVLNEEVLYLPLKYNVQNGSICKSPISEITEYYGIPHNYTKDDIIKSAAILHLAAPWKPWIFSNTLYSPQWNDLYKEVFGEDYPGRIMLDTPTKRSIFQLFPFSMTTEDLLLDFQIHLYIPYNANHLNDIYSILELARGQSLIPNKIIFFSDTHVSQQSLVAHDILVEYYQSNSSALIETITDNPLSNNVIRIFSPPSLLQNSFYVESLIQTHIIHPKSICATSCCSIQTNYQGKISPPKDWSFQPVSNIPSYALVALDNGGILLPPSFKIDWSSYNPNIDPIVAVNLVIASNNTPIVHVDVGREYMQNFDNHRLIGLQSLLNQTQREPLLRTQLFLSSKINNAFKWQQDELTRKYIEIHSIKCSSPYKFSRFISSLVKKIKKLF